MGLTNEYVGPNIVAKIKIYVLTRAELLFNLCYEIPCSKIVYQYVEKTQEHKNRMLLQKGCQPHCEYCRALLLFDHPGEKRYVWIYWEVTYFSHSYFSAYVCRWFLFSKSFIGRMKKSRCCPQSCQKNRYKKCWTFVDIIARLTCSQGNWFEGYHVKCKIYPVKSTQTFSWRASWKKLGCTLKNQKKIWQAPWKSLGRFYRVDFTRYPSRQF